MENRPDTGHEKPAGRFSRMGVPVNSRVMSPFKNRLMDTNYRGIYPK